MNKQQKTERVDRYGKALDESTYAILAEFAGLPVSTIDSMRDELEKLGCQVVVMKNTLAKIAFERNGYEEACEFLVGPSILFYGGEEVTAAAKQIQRYTRRYPMLKVKSILYEHSVFPREQFVTFTNLPTKQEIRARLLYVIKAPQTQFVGVINVASRIAGVLGAYARKREG